MSGRTGNQLYIRSLIEVSSDVIPFFWPMRNFIHHNPLYGLEGLEFRDALKTGGRLFHGRVYLPRKIYQRFLQEGRIEEGILREEVSRFVEANKPDVGDKVDLVELSLELMKNSEESLGKRPVSLECCDWAIEIAEKLKLSNGDRNLPVRFLREFVNSLGKDITLYDAVDLLFGTNIGSSLNELTIKVCMEFLDEGQATWGMPYRREGFYKSWRRISRSDMGLCLSGCYGTEELLERCKEPEEAVEFVLESMEIPKELWEHYFPLELAKLHGWSGFIRWRSHTRDYYWQKRYPADLVDFLAIRLTLALSLLKGAKDTLPFEPTFNRVIEFVENNTEEAFLRYELYSNSVIPEFADRVSDVIELGSKGSIKKLCDEYVAEKLKNENRAKAVYLVKLFKAVGEEEKLAELEAEELNQLLRFFKRFEEEEGYLWLKAHERTKLHQLIGGLSVTEGKKEDRAFAQALFCIDVRSERFRRNLERIEGYETYGIAGFFGVPISFIELGKGHETYLCPVLIKPKNVVMEMYKHKREEGEKLWHVVKEILHDLKNNVFTPYITVEAIGLLFGFDMVGKTLFPLGYSKFRERLYGHKGETTLIIDKIPKEDVYQIIETLQIEILKRAFRRELGVEVGERTLKLTREVALERKDISALLTEESGELRDKGVDTDALKDFIEKVRKEYKIDRGYTRVHVEKLSKVGFTVEEQVHFVEKALKMVGLTENFGRFVLTLGHGSKSDNNPYESALDCGACGGDHGIVNARVFCFMANKKEVRERLRERGIDIPEDTLFLAGEHNTTTDEVEFFDTDLIPPTHKVFLEKLVEDIKLAGVETAYERCKELPVSRCDSKDSAIKSILRNSVDWTQVRPEWGLSGNYAFVIGRRELTREMNLQGRVFLHSYDYRIDPKGFYLENILSGPLIVGEWINMEHYFSAVDNEHFGSGSKVYHNVVGRLGVISGNLSDLRTGLPAQTVLRGELPHHEPIRLITLIEAPLELVKKSIKMVQKVRELVHNGWINLVVLDPLKGEFYIFSEGEWRRLKDEKP